MVQKARPGQTRAARRVYDRAAIPCARNPSSDVLIVKACGSILT
jgi:hypothetical protein